MNIWQRLKLNLVIFCFLITIILVQSEASAQSFKITYLNTNNYPVIEAGFVATNSDGIKIFNSSVKDFSILENSQQSKVLEVNNPQQEYQSVSIVLMADISLSMQNRRIELVKDGLIDFIDQIPLETSEVAIACFSDESYIYTDFTQNRNRLISAVNRLQNINGTDFNKAFMDPEQGALALSNSSRNKKVIVFITDGLSTTNAERISELANKQGSTVFTLNINLAIPEDLKTLTTQTGGLYFEKIMNQNQFRSAASAIFQQLKCTDFGTVKWLSNLDCAVSKPVILNYKNTKLEFDYNVPTDKVGRIDANPSLVQFGTGKIGTVQNQYLTITPQNIPVTVTGIDIDTSSLFKITDVLKFPIQLKSGESFRTKINYTAREAGLHGDNIKISFGECPDINVNVRAGGQEDIKLLFPKGGEIFGIGEDTSILWEGVKKTMAVEMYYKLHEKDDWTFIDKKPDLKYLWKLPMDTSSKVMVRLVPVKSPDENMEVSAIIDGNTSPVLNASFSPDGTKIITTDNQGFVKTWDSQTGKIISSLGGYDTKKAVIAPDNERIFLLLKDEIFVWNLETDRLAGRASNLDKKVYTSMLLPDGQEVLAGGNVSTDPAKNARIWSGISAYKTFLINQPDIKWASFTADGQFTVTLDNKGNIKVFKTDSAQLIQTFHFKETVSQVIISPDGTKALVKLPQEMRMLDLISYRELYGLQKTQYKQFTFHGKYFIAEESSKALNFIETASGKSVFIMPSTKFYEVSPKSKFVIYNQHDTLILFDFKKQKNILTIPRKSFRIARFDENETKVYVLTINNLLEIYDTETADFLGVMEGFSRKIKELIANPITKQLALLTDDNRFELWSPSTSGKMKEAVSGYFSLTSPKPVVIDTIQFDEQILNSGRELNIKKFAINPGKIPINILNIRITGKDASEFEVVSKIFPQNINSNSQLDQEFRFTPNKTGTREAKVITCTATDTFLTVITGKGVEQHLQPLVRYIDFGKVKLGQQKDTLASIFINSGTDTILLNSLKNSGPDENQFKMPINKTIKIAPKDTFKILLQFNPVTRGKATTLLVLPSSEDTKIILRGEGTAPREIVLTGVTRNIADNIPVEANVKKIDLASNIKMEEVFTGADGKFKFTLMADRNFGIIAEKENFVAASLNIDLSEKITGDTIKQDIYLTEIKPGAIIPFNCIFFETDKSTLIPSSDFDLKRLLEIIQKYKLNSFEIRGHTDSKGSESYNLNLSKARAATVMNYLTKNGISKERLSVQFFGESKPVADNATDEGRALNRRVELKVVK